MEKPHSDENYAQPVKNLMQGFPDEQIANYLQLVAQDLHLGELYRLALGPKNIEEKRKRINPLQAEIDSNGQIWVDVLFEKKKNINLNQLREIMRVHGTPDKRCFLTGKIRAEMLPALLKMTTRLQTARPISAETYDSLPSIHADQAELNSFAQQQGLGFVPDGSGVIVGIVDTGGCDFKHPHFLKNGQTRLLYLWDQNGTSTSNSPNHPPYGVEYTQQDINAALNSADPYQTLNYKPVPEAHGTHVMGIAAGSYPTHPGVAPGADLIFVHIGLAAFTKAEERGNLGSSKCLLDAVKYIFEKAGAKPVVVNISLGGNGGPHDGTSLVENGLDELLQAQPGNCAIVIAAGNNFDKGIHTSGNVTSGQTYTLEWNIPNRLGSSQGNGLDLGQELEIWYTKNSCLRATIFDPQGMCCCISELDSGEQCILDNFGNPTMMIRHVCSGDENLIDLFIYHTNPNTPSGMWAIDLSLVNSQKASFCAWIERNDALQTHFEPQTSMRCHTLNTIANGVFPLAVGAYDSHFSRRPIAYYSSQGLSRIRKPADQRKPELCAPGQGISAANALKDLDDGDVMIDKSGTSMAAPHVAGVIALMLQVATQQQPPRTRTIQEIRNILIGSVDPYNGASGFHPRYGFGYVNACKALEEILK